MALVDRVKAHLALDHVRLAHAGKDLIQTVAVCAGSGASVLKDIPADVYVTGEMGHHEVLAALEQGTSVILCEHTNTERGYLSLVLQSRLQHELGQGLDVVVSQVDQDPLKVV
jgi:putative NIF3 family GTP cyclohydrolase 1 type 2